MTLDVRPQLRKPLPRSPHKCHTDDSLPGGGAGGSLLEAPRSLRAEGGGTVVEPLLVGAAGLPGVRRQMPGERWPGFQGWSALH